MKKNYLDQLIYSILNSKDIKATRAKNLLLNRTCEECYHMSSNNYCTLTACSLGGYGQVKVKDNYTCRDWKDVQEHKHGKYSRLRIGWA